MHFNLPGLQRSSFRSGGAPRTLKGAEVLHPNWSSAAVAAAVAAATAHQSVAGLDDSRSSGENSDSFLLQLHGGEFSRDNYQNDKRVNRSPSPPPNPSEIRCDSYEKYQHLNLSLPPPPSYEIDEHVNIPPTPVELFLPVAKDNYSLRDDLCISGFGGLSRSVQSEPRFCGNWNSEGKTMTISSTSLTWSNGDTQSITITDDRTFSLLLEGTTYSAVLKDDGKLHWTDGEIWMRDASALLEVRAQKPLSREQESTLHEQDHWPTHPFGDHIQAAAWTGSQLGDATIHTRWDTQLPPPPSHIHSTWDLSSDHSEERVPHHSELPELIFPGSDNRNGPPSVEFAPQPLEKIDDAFWRNSGTSYQPWSPWQTFGFAQGAREDRPLDPVPNEYPVPLVLSVPISGDIGIAKFDDLGISSLQACSGAERTSGENVGRRGSYKSRITERAGEIFRDANLRSKTFRLSLLPESFGGTVPHFEREELANWPRCIRILCKHFPGWVAFLCLVCGLAFMFGLTGILWIGCDATVTEGAFGLITQTSRSGPIDWHYFIKAQQLAITSLRVVDNTTNYTMDHDHLWFRLELTYASTSGFDIGLIGTVQSIESRLRNLPGWQRLCEEAPSEHRHFCLPGDSFAAILFGSMTELDASSPLSAQGGLASVDFDGRGAMIAQLRQYVKDFFSSYVKRWFANSEPDSPLRSTFAFHLKTTSVKAWTSFLEEELHPLLKEIAIEGEIETGTFQTAGEAAEKEEMATGRVRVYYRGDYLESDEFQEAVWADDDWRAFAPISTLVATLLMTRRMILALVSLALAICAPMLATVVVSRNEDGKAEYPVIAVAAWFIVASSCADLAIACDSGWALAKDFSLQNLPQYCGGKQFNPFRRFVIFLNEVPVPLLASIGMLLISGSIPGWSNDLPLVQEFSLHAGVGLLFALIFGIVIYPPALEVGDAFNQRSKDSDACLTCHDRIHGHTVFECGDPPLWWQNCSKSLHFLVDALQSRAVRFSTFAVVLGLILGASIPDSSPNFTGKVPELFHEGHRLREKPKVFALFGSGELLGQSEAPMKALSGTYSCKPDAQDKLDCAWYECEANNQQNPKPGTCSCYVNSDNVSKAELGTCGAAARFMSLIFGTHDDFAKTTFWEWVETTLDIVIINNTATAQMMGQLKVENWETGLNTFEPQMAVKIPGRDGSLPDFEDACLRIMCYCGEEQCKLEGKTKAWTALGDVPSPLTRRLDSEPQPQPLVATTEVFIVLGLVRTTEIPAKSSIYSGFEFGAFDVTDPWTQRGLLGMCLGAPPTLRIVSRRCWISDFKTWLHGRGEQFPVPASDFTQQFKLFLAYAASRSTEEVAPISSTLPTKMGQGSYNFFWLESDSTVLGCYLSFAVDAPDPDNVQAIDEYHGLWNAFLSQRVSKARGKIASSWVTSPIFATREAAAAVKDAARTTLTWAYLFCFLATFLRTWSIGLTVAVLIVLSMCFGTVVFIAVVIGARDFGAIELICFCTFMSNLLPPLVRITYQYSIARDGPGAKPLPSKYKDFVAQSKREFRPRRSSMDSTTADRSSVSILQLFSMSPPVEQTYLVDNSILQAGTSGLGYRLSPRIEDVDPKGDFRSLAPWGSTVVGSEHGPWVRVAGRYLPTHLKGIQVLRLQEANQLDEDIGDVDSGLDDYTRLGKWGERSHFENLYIIRDLFIHFFVHVIMPSDHRDVWEGCCQSERSRRLVTVLRRDGLVILGAALAGVITGGGMVPLRMEALSQIGLASLCSSLTLPPAALGLLPVLILLRLGPTRSRRRALYIFSQWLRDGRPAGAPKPSVMSQSETGVQNSLSQHTKMTKAADLHPGEIAASELGFPFSLAVRSLADHLPLFFSFFSFPKEESSNGSSHSQGKTVVKFHKVDKYEPSPYDTGIPREHAPLSPVRLESPRVTGHRGAHGNQLFSVVA